MTNCAISCYNVPISDFNMIIGSRFHPKPPPEDKNCIEFILERPCRLYPNKYAVVSPLATNNLHWIATNKRRLGSLMLICIAQGESVGSQFKHCWL